MKLLDLVRRGLRHHRRRHLGVLLGAAVAAGVLVGALAVGDSVRASLRAQALLRVGPVKAALASGDRLFEAGLGARLTSALSGDSTGARLATTLALEGVAALPDGSARASGVQVLGVDRAFLALAGRPASEQGPGPRQALVSTALARRLGLAAGDTLVVRVEPPSAVPRDMVLAQNDDVSRALRVEVIGELADEHLGRFALSAGPSAPLSVFVDLEWLRLQVEAEGRANLILAAGAAPAPELTARLGRALADTWTLADGELELRPVGARPRPESEADPESNAAADPDQLELRTRRVFLDPPVASAPALAGGTRVLTYFVNELRSGEAATPYSMVAAVDPAPGSPLAALLPAELADDEVVINAWLARDLGAGPGDPLSLRYYALGPNRRLVEERAEFRVAAVVPLEGAAADPTLMPDFPGLADAEHCRDWEAGVPIDLEAVGDEDEAYWDAHRGTPKAFVTLAAGQRLWGNRFGVLTSVRVPLEPSSGDAATAARALPALVERLRAELDPAALGLAFRDLRTPALAASDPATDFGGLFLGLSLFLLGAALLLTALLFALGVESRASEIGTLAAVGFPPVRIRRLFLLEGGAVAALGALAGVALGLLYTRGVLAALATVWRGAVGDTPLGFHASPASAFGGAVGSVLVALLAMRLALRGQIDRPAAELVRASPAGDAALARPGRVAPLLAVLALLGAVGAALSAPGSNESGAAASARAGAFFGAGALVLVAGLAAVRVLLTRRASRRSRPPASLRALGASGAARRPGRSLATVALLAAGSFLVLAVGVHHRGTETRPGQRSAGTGGFALFARSSLPVLNDLESEAGREAFGLEAADLAGVAVVPLRVRAGDDASCLQLGVPQEPELLGVDPEALARRGAFTFAATLEDPDHKRGDPWRLLERPADGAVPAVADHASAAWTMKKSLGETFDYVDERGEPFRVRLVGTLQGSILQGSLVIAERDFEARYPSIGGHQAFLIDVDPGPGADPGSASRAAARAAEVAATLGKALEDVGLEVTPAAARLAEFDRVQNTYLLVFQLLGGLGLLLGSAGLGLVVLRNALERRAELAALRAVGFSRGDVRRLLFFEHLELFALGLGLGAVAAAVAWVPTAAGGPLRVPTSVPVLFAALGLSGLVWVAWAARAASRGSLVDALAEE